MTHTKKLESELIEEKSIAVASADGVVNQLQKIKSGKDEDWEMVRELQLELNQLRKEYDNKHQLMANHITEVKDVRNGDTNSICI